MRRRRWRMFCRKVWKEENALYKEENLLWGIL
jgi:hypothetical protein